MVWFDHSEGTFEKIIDKVEEGFGKFKVSYHSFPKLTKFGENLTIVI